MEDRKCINCDDSGYLPDTPLVTPCQECCEHEFDWDEGYTCLNCGLQGDIGSLIDNAEYNRGDR